jgi:hypothetical protein
MTQADAAGVANVWRDQRQWSHEATRLRQRIVVWRSTALAFAIRGAVLATLAKHVGLKTELGRDLALAATVMLAIVPVIRQARLGDDNIEAWTRARFASEGLKAETYLYLTRNPPYDGPDRDVVLSRETDSITRDVDDLARQTLGMPEADMPLPGVSDVESYLTVRVQPQIDEFYRQGASQQQRRLTLFRSIESALSLSVALLGAIAAVTRLDSVGVWVGVVTTVAAAITAHIAVVRYEHVVISYLATARQLRALLWNWRDGIDRSAPAAAKLIRDCEDVISRENESWIAAWSRGEDGALASPGP